MASEVLKLSLLLELKNNASGGIREFMGDLKRLDSQTKQNLKTLEKFRGELNKKLKFGGFTGDEKIVSDLKKVSKQLQTTNKDLDKVRSNASRGLGSGSKLGFEGATIRGLKAIDAQAITTHKSLGKVRGHANKQLKGGANPSDDLLDREPTTAGRARQRRRLRDPFAEPETAIERAAGIHDRYIEPLTQAKDVVRSKIDDFQPYYDAAIKLARAQSQFRLMGRSPEENARAFKVVEDSIKSMGLVTKADGIDLMTELVNSLADVDKAASMFDTTAKYAFGMKSTFGTSQEQLTEQIQNSFKFLELTGQTSAESMKRTFDMIARIAASTGGRISGQDFLAMAKTGAVAVRDLDEKGLLNLSTVFPEMGASRTGTSLMSAHQAIVGGKMSQASRNRFKYFGMLQDGMYEENKTTGAVKSMQPGAILGSDIFQRDPLAFADKLRDAMAAKGVPFEYDLQGNLSDESARRVNQELSQLFSNRRAFDLMSTLVTQRGQVQKEAANALRAMGVDKMFEESMESGTGKVLKFEVALERFREQVGGPLLGALTGLATAALPLVSFFGDHPNVTKYGIALMLASKGASAFFQIASIFNTSRMDGGSFFRRAADGVADMADVMGSSRSRVSGFTRELEKAEQKAGGLRGAVGRLASSPAVQLGLTVGAVAIAAGATEFIIEQIQEDLDRKAKNAELKIRLNATVDDVYFNGGSEEGMRQTFFKQLEDNGQLEKSLHPEKNTWTDTLWGLYTNPWNPVQNPLATGIANYINPSRHQYGPNYSGYGLLPSSLTGQTSDASASAIAQIMANKNMAKAVRHPQLAAGILGDTPKWAEGLGFNRADLATLNSAIKQLIITSSGDPQKGLAKWEETLAIMQKRGLGLPLMTTSTVQEPGKPTLPMPVPGSPWMASMPWGSAKNPIGGATRDILGNLNFGGFRGFPTGFNSFEAPRPSVVGPMLTFQQTRSTNSILNSTPSTPGLFDLRTQKNVGVFPSTPSLPAPLKPAPVAELASLFDLKLNKFVSGSGMPGGGAIPGGIQSPQNVLFTQLTQQSGTAAESLTKLVQPSGDASDRLSKLVDPADKLPGKFTNIAGSADGLVNAFNSAQEKMAGFSVPIPSVVTDANGNQRVVVSGGGGPSRAIGGIVERDGWAYVHSGNTITPARVTRGLEGYNDLMGYVRDKRSRSEPFDGLVNSVFADRQENSPSSTEPSILNLVSDFGNIKDPSSPKGGLGFEPSPTLSPQVLQTNSSAPININVTIEAPLTIQASGPVDQNSIRELQKTHELQMETIREMIETKLDPRELSALMGREMQNSRQRG